MAQSAEVAPGVYVVNSPGDRDITASLILSRQDYPGPFAHFLEHLAGSTQENPSTHDRDVDASTDAVAIRYWQRGPKQKLPDVVRKLLATLQPLDAPNTFVMQERDIILREYELCMSDNPDREAAETARAIFYKGHPYATSSPGSCDDIRAITYDSAKAFHAAPIGWNVKAWWSRVMCLLTR